MRRLTSKLLAAGVIVSIAACGQQPGRVTPQAASDSTSVAPSTDDSPTKTDDNPTTKGTNPGGAAISRDRAVEIALDRTGGGNIDEVENEFEHGRAAWKVRVVKNGTRYSVYIDKVNGDIIRFRSE